MVAVSSSNTVVKPHTMRLVPVSALVACLAVPRSGRFDDFTVWAKLASWDLFEDFSKFQLFLLF